MGTPTFSPAHRREWAGGCACSTAFGVAETRSLVSRAPNSLACAVDICASNCSEAHPCGRRGVGRAAFRGLARHAMSTGKRAGRLGQRPSLRRSRRADSRMARSSLEAPAGILAAPQVHTIRESIFPVLYQQLLMLSLLRPRLCRSRPLSTVKTSQHQQPLVLSRSPLPCD